MHSTGHWEILLNLLLPNLHFFLFNCFRHCKNTTNWNLISASESFIPNWSSTYLENARSELFQKFPQKISLHMNCFQSWFKMEMFIANSKFTLNNSCNFLSVGIVTQNAYRNNHCKTTCGSWYWWDKFISINGHWKK